MNQDACGAGMHSFRLYALSNSLSGTLQQTSYGNPQPALTGIHCTPCAVIVSCNCCGLSGAWTQDDTQTDAVQIMLQSLA